jgi:hypothetical protein
MRPVSIRSFELVAGCQLGLVGGVETFAISAASTTAGLAEEIALDVFFAVFGYADQGSFANGVVFYAEIDVLWILYCFM